MQKSFAEDIRNHRLSREIIATMLANDVINRGGLPSSSDMREATGAPSEDIVRAYLIARDMLELNELFDQIDKLDNKVDGAVQNDLYAAATQAIRHAALWILKLRFTAGDLGQTIEQARSTVRELARPISRQLPKFLAGGRQALAADLVAGNVPERLAASIADLPVLALLPQIMKVASATSTTPRQAAAVFFAVTERFRISQIEASAARIAPSDRFERLALSRAIDEISIARQAIAAAVLDEFAGKRKPLDQWLKAHADRAQRAPGSRRWH